MIKQAIPGVAPPELGEVTVAITWPSIAAWPLGRLLGRLYEIRAGIGIITIGRIMMIASIPVALALYFRRIMPFVGFRYRLTNRRVMVEKGLSNKLDRFVELDRFDRIDLEVLPGQAWYPAGDLIFRKGNVETFRLQGVARPEGFRRTCLSAHLAYVGVQQALKRG